MKVSEEKNSQILNMSDEEFYSIPLLKEIESIKVHHVCNYCKKQIKFVSFSEGAISCPFCDKFNRVEKGIIY